MSRFDPARRGRILAWTGAALAWGTAATMAGLEPPGGEAGAPAVATRPPTTVVASTSEIAALPDMPAGGLVILRYQSSVERAPDVRTLYVQQKAPQTAKAGPAQTAPAPAPRSGGS